MAGPVPAEWLIDAMNVVGSRPTGWWRDRAGALRALHADVRRAATATGRRATLVIDGRPLPGLAPGERDGVRIEYAPGGPDAADDRIVELVAAASDPAALCVVTSDRALAARVRRHGARVQGARTWLESASR
jgi:uncharacterized protein YaiI (UPF0178 family)